MHARGLRPRRARSMLAISHSSMLPSAHWNSVGTLISDHFHGSIPCLHVPLSTLHVQPRDCPRMTRGQVGSLRLTCTTLAFATSRRFIPAHSNCVQNSPNCIAKPRRDSLSVFASHARAAHSLLFSFLAVRAGPRILGR